MTINFTPEPFTPHPLMKNPHLQSILGSVARRQTNVTYRRQRLDTNDGDFIDIDFAQVASVGWLPQSAPILLLLHGLEGNARKGYAVAAYQQAARAGMRPVGMNFRSCSGEMNCTAQFYHMGATEDVAFVVDWLLDSFPDAPIVMVGVSLGGNMTLKYLGEQSDNINPRIIGAAAISPPIIATGKQAINHGVGRLYGMYLVRPLKAKVRQKIDLVRNSPADGYAALKAQTLREFDDAITAPLHGFANAEDYYAQCNSINFLPDIRVPTLIIRAKDDPFFNDDIPYDVIAQNEALYGAFPEHGGHVGFLEGAIPFHYTNWAQRQVMRFFDNVLREDDA